MFKKILSFAILACSTSAFSQAPATPQDRPVASPNLDSYKQMLEAIKPYVAQARKTWPEVKGRYLKGLPAKHVFSVTTELTDMGGNHEIVFVTVQKIEQGVVSGTITSNIHAVRGYKLGQAYSVKETDIVDWTINRPDGTEEGNVVGKFLESVAR